MAAYIIRRLLYTIPIVFGVLLLTFVLIKVVGGDISREIAGKNASPRPSPRSKKNTASINRLFFRLNSQFIDHFKRAITLNFGQSLDREYIIDKILRGAGPSLSLTVPMFFGEVIAL